MIDKSKIGERIKTVRNDKDMTQEELAEAVEISTNYLSKIERGKNLPNAEIFLKIMQTLNLSLEDFGIIPEADLSACKKDLLHVIHTSDNQMIEALTPVVKCVLESFKYIRQKT